MQRRASEVHNTCMLGCLGVLISFVERAASPPKHNVAHNPIIQSALTAAQPHHTFRGAPLNCRDSWRASSTPILRQPKKPSMDHGAAQYPRFVEHLLQLGWVNVSQMMPAELCGLV